MHGRFWKQVFALGLCFCASVWASGRAPAQPADVTGIWVLSADGVAGKCRILLRPELSAAGGRQMTIPLLCLRTFPLLGPAETWSAAKDGGLEFKERSGRIVIAFAAQAGDFVASGPQGLAYRLVPLVNQGQEKGQSPGPGNRLAPLLAAAGERPPAEPKPGPEGRYSVLREDGKDTGCMLILDNKGKPSKMAKASLAPGCRDQGIVIFDPAGWQIVNGRLVLTARKGHKTYLDAQPDGTWKKDPSEGKVLSLKRL